MKSLFSKEKWQQLFYTVSHPSDGFYWIRHGEKGSVAIAILMVVLFGLCFTLNRLLAGFVVNDIMVHSSYRRQGLGDRIMNAIDEYFEEHAHADSYICLIANQPADKLYLKHKFAYLPGHKCGMLRMQN